MLSKAQKNVLKLITVFFENIFSYFEFLSQVQKWTKKLELINDRSSFSPKSIMNFWPTKENNVDHIKFFTEQILFYQLWHRLLADFNAVQIFVFVFLFVTVW